MIVSLWSIAPPERVTVVNIAGLSDHSGTLTGPE